MLTFFSLLFFQFQFPLFSGVCRAAERRGEWFPEWVIFSSWAKNLRASWPPRGRLCISGVGRGLCFTTFSGIVISVSAREIERESQLLRREWATPVSSHEPRLWQCSVDAAFAFPLRMSRSISMAGTLGQHGRTKATSTKQDNDCERVWEWMRECCVSVWVCDCASGLLFTTTMTIITVMMKGKL